MTWEQVFPTSSPGLGCLAATVDGIRWHRLADDECLGKRLEVSELSVTRCQPQKIDRESKEVLKTRLLALMDCTESYWGAWLEKVFALHKPGSWHALLTGTCQER